MITRNNNGVKKNLSKYIVAALFVAMLLAIVQLLNTQQSNPFR